MKKLIVIIIVLVAVGVGAGAFYMNRATPEPTVTSGQLSRGDVVDVVAATGTLEAVTTVQVGTQVSGTVQELYADFNDIVKKGKVIARLDPSLLQTQIEQQKANVTRSEADLERLKVSLADAKQKAERAHALSDKNLLPKDGCRDRRRERPLRRSADQVVGSQPRAGALAAEYRAGQPRAHDHHRADRRHRHLAAGRAGPDRRGQHERASALHPRRRPHADADQREHRRGGRGPDAPRPGRQLPRGRLPHRDLHGRGAAGAPAARRRCRTS